MSRLEFIRRFKKKEPALSHLEISSLIDIFCKTIQKALKENKKVELREFGNFFTKKISILLEAGCHQIILDPGFGFGKTVAHNYELLDSIDHFKMLGWPILIGVSRKSMIWKLLKTKPETSLNGTSIINTIAMLKGASILRVHDTKYARELVTIWDTIGQIHH